MDAVPPIRQGRAAGGLAQQPLPACVRMCAGFGGDAAVAPDDNPALPDDAAEELADVVPEAEAEVSCPEFQPAITTAQPRATTSFPNARAIPAPVSA